jgi:hypothetical protein
MPVAGWQRKAASAVGHSRARAKLAADWCD